MLWVFFLFLIAKLSRKNSFSILICWIYISFYMYFCLFYFIYDFFYLFNLRAFVLLCFSFTFWNGLLFYFWTELVWLVIAIHYWGTLILKSSDIEWKINSIDLNEHWWLKHNKIKHNSEKKNVFIWWWISMTNLINPWIIKKFNVYILLLQSHLIEQ